MVDCSRTVGRLHVALQCVDPVFSGGCGPQFCRQTHCQWGGKEARGWTATWHQPRCSRGPDLNLPFQHRGAHVVRSPRARASSSAGPTRHCATDPTLERGVGHCRCLDCRDRPERRWHAKQRLPRRTSHGFGPAPQRERPFLRTLVLDRKRICHRIFRIVHGVLPHARTDAFPGPHADLDP